MDHATCFRLLSATHFATSLLPLTVRLIPVLTEIGRLIVGFRRAELTPQVCHQFETQLHTQLRELGQIIVEWTFNHIGAHGVGHAQPDVFPGNLVSPPFQDPKPQSGHPLWHHHPLALSINRSTASNRRSFPWRSAWGWKSVWPHRL